MNTKDIDSVSRGVVCWRVLAAWRHKKGPRVSMQTVCTRRPGQGSYLATVASFFLPHSGQLTVTFVWDQAYTFLPHFSHTHASVTDSGFGGKSSFPHSGHRSSGILFTSRILSRYDSSPGSRFQSASIESLGKRAVFRSGVSAPSGCSNSGAANTPSPT